MAIWASGDRVVPAKLNIGAPAGVSAIAVTATSDTTTSSSYVNMAGTGSQTSFSFTKLNTSTRIEVFLALDVYTTTNTASGFAGVRINGTDYDVVSIPTSTTSVRAPQASTIWISGVAAGTYTVQGRWRRAGGSGTYTRDTLSWLTISAREVA